MPAKPSLVGTEFTCKECGVRAIWNSRQRSSFCGPRCNGINYSRANSRARARRIRAATVENVDPFVVFRRDGFKCRACGIETPWAFRGKMYDNAPEVDHIIPIGLGGPHSYANTQCLCRKCNLQKGMKMVCE